MPPPPLKASSLVLTSHSCSKWFLLCFRAAVMTQTVQTNGVQPLSKTWELSLYELQRTPQVTPPPLQAVVRGGV